MLRWLKRIGCGFLLLVLLLVAAFLFVYAQGVQHVIAWTGGGYANPLPAADAYPIEEHGCASGPLTVVTFNVFNGSAWVQEMVEEYAGGDLQGMLPWSQRIEEVRARIAEYDADLIGLQEMGSDHDIAQIIPPEAGYTLLSYKAGDFEYGDSALLYRTERFEALDSGQLWLTPTPDLPMSFGFLKLSMLRYVNWVVLREKETGFTFLFANTHFDNNGGNKIPSSALFRERITALTGGLPLVVTGDFNSRGDTERYGVFTGADHDPPLLQNTGDIVDTQARRFKGLNRSEGVIPEEEEMMMPIGRIDHIFVGGPCPVEVSSWILDARRMKSGDELSDHELIAAEVEFGAAEPTDGAGS